MKRTRDDFVYLHLYFFPPKFMNDLFSIREPTYFAGYMDDEFDILVNAAVLWNSMREDRIHKVHWKHDKVLVPSSLDDFLELIFEPLIDSDTLTTSSKFVKYDQPYIQGQRTSHDKSNYYLLLRRYKAYFDSRKTQQVSAESVTCVYSHDSRVLSSLGKTVNVYVSISSQMSTRKKASLLSKCDILVSDSSFNPAFFFFMKAEISMIGLNLNQSNIQPWTTILNLKIFNQNYQGTEPPLQSIKLLNDLVKRQSSGKNKFLMFMPWEQLNNQIIGFKAACGMAQTLDRILVTPFLGYRIRHEWNFSFSHKDYLWAPMEKYFDFHDTACKIISLSDFKLLHGIRIGRIHFNPVAKATSHQQINDYYKDILRLHHSSIVDHSKMSQLNSSDILKMFGDDTAPVLSFGSLFWAFGFNRSQTYPPREYSSYIKNNLYKDITKSFRLKANLIQFVQKSVRQRIGSKPMVSVHLRRGDYWNKCKAISDPSIQLHCFPSIEIIKNKISTIIGNQGWDKTNADKRVLTEWDQDGAYIYISTNLNSDRSELTELIKSFNVLFFEDIFDAEEIRKNKWDPIHLSLIDIELGRIANFFIGNYFSSFSRTIFEARELERLPFETF